MAYQQPHPASPPTGGLSAQEMAEFEALINPYAPFSLEEVDPGLLFDIGSLQPLQGAPSTIPVTSAMPVTSIGDVPQVAQLHTSHDAQYPDLSNLQIDPSFWDYIDSLDKTPAQLGSMVNRMPSTGFYDPIRFQGFNDLLFSGPMYNTPEGAAPLGLAPGPAYPYISNVPYDASTPTDLPSGIFSRRGSSSSDTSTSSWASSTFLSTPTTLVQDLFPLERLPETQPRLVFNAPPASVQGVIRGTRIKKHASQKMHPYRVPGMSATSPAVAQTSNSTKVPCTWPGCTSEVTKKNLKRHIATMHTEDTLYKCLVCGSDVGRADNRKTHFKSRNHAGHDLEGSDLKAFIDVNTIKISSTTLTT